MIIENSYHFIRFIAENDKEEEYLKKMTPKEEEENARAALRIMGQIQEIKRIRI
jgi:hypothetical protein